MKTKYFGIPVFVLTILLLMISPVMANEISYTPETIYVGDSVIFKIPKAINDPTPPGLPLSIESVNWNFGDGWNTKLYSASATHVYTITGGYKVTAYATYSRTYCYPWFCFTKRGYRMYSIYLEVLPLIPPVEDTEDYIEYVNETVQEISFVEFAKPEEDVTDIKYDFSDKFSDIFENIDEENYERAIEHLEEIKAFVCEQMVESDESKEIIDMINNLIAYLKIS